MQYISRRLTTFKCRGNWTCECDIRASRAILTDANLRGDGVMVLKAPWDGCMDGVPNWALFLLSTPNNLNTALDANSSE